VSELEERVKKLETLLGTDSPHLSTIFDQSVADERNLSAAISDVQDKLAVLDTTHVEHIDARLQGVLHHLDELSSKTSEKENVEKEKKISELYDLVRKWDATADVVPELIHRLETLKSLHDQATDNVCSNNDYANLDSHTSLTNITLSENEVLNCLQNINVSKASGPDGIPGRLLKAIATEITPSLTKVFNLSLCSGKVPSAWKTALITPILKE
ncbi:dynactin subunit 2-like, partial [Paramuricea clavata]